MAPAQRDAFTAEMQAAGVDQPQVVYGGALHAVHPKHAQRAWRDFVDLLAECLPITK